MAARVSPAADPVLKLKPKPNKEPSLGPCRTKKMPRKLMGSLSGGSGANPRKAPSPNPTGGTVGTGELLVAGSNSDGGSGGSAVIAPRPKPKLRSVIPAKRKSVKRMMWESAVRSVKSFFRGRYLSASGQT